MRVERASTVAILTVLAVLLLTAPRRAAAQVHQDVTVRMDAIGALLAEITHLRPVSIAKARPDLLRITKIAFIDDQSSWIPQPGPVPVAFDTAGVLQCVPYARFMSGISLRGDAWTWWDKAAGIYARGNHPEPGAVLSFPGIERMPLGHVAVVTQVLTARKILIDHANWPNAVVPHGAISRDIQVADVSAGNDWTEVRVQFGEGGPLGSVYPANGFIYGWTEAGVQIAHPKFSLDYALWSPSAASWRMFNSINFLWALPPAERKKAYAAAGVIPPTATQTHGRPVLVLGPADPGLNASALARPIGLNRLDAGSNGKISFGAGRFVIQ
jgi:hypothetical protein